MNDLFVYLLQSSVCLSVLFVFYLLLLKKETFYIANRIYLLTMVVFSFTAPLLKIWQPVTEYTKEITYYLSPIMVKNTSETSASNLLITRIPEIIYFVVASALLMKLLIRLIRILLLVRKSERITVDGQKIVLLKQEVTPFSFFGNIFMTREQLSEPFADSIIAHEKGHIQQVHSFDMILFEIVKIIQWFNPLTWKLKKEIEAQHEFSADSTLVSRGLNIPEYKSLLACYSFNLNANIITNNFNSLLKRRFEMLSKEKSNSFGKIKFFFAVPLAAMLMIFMGAVNSNGPFQINQDGKNKVYAQVDQMPEFPGGNSALINYINKNVIYPEDAKKAGTQGKVFVQFVIDKDGSVTDVKIQKGTGNSLDKEALRVIKGMPKWTPGKDKGQPVKVSMVMPIMFSLKK